MVLKVDLGCKRCYKKIKKLLSKIPEIQDWTFFEKENAVMIKILSSSAEKIRMQLKSKGGETIKSLEVRQPEKPKPPVDKTKPPAAKPKEADQKPKPPAEKQTPVPGCPPGYRIGGCCKPCHEGHCGGPCHHGLPSNDGWASGCRCNRSCGRRCEFLSIEENPICTIL
ncbi:hypothetical protein PVL29_012574 [Vitis rotundifolia]|uniref:HMA domain-containing protein n=1 Tax=Vitis rotundifolia TaxID=103349 RepID=A0AA38ZJ08_VITRO|nr:hypothetical protein PVL29_012574 [Vitis rotundifolia]